MPIFEVCSVREDRVAALRGRVICPLDGSNFDFNQRAKTTSTVEESRHLGRQRMKIVKGTD